MGNTTSTQNFIKNETNMSLTQKYVTNNLLTDSTNSANIQTINITVTDGDGCPVTTNQSITNNISLKTQLDSNNTTNFTNSLQQSLSSTLSQNASMVNGFASATGGNATNVTNSIQNTINEKVQQSCTVNNIMKVAKSSYNQQTATLTMDFCRNSPIQMNQTIVSNIVAQNILTSVANALMADTTVSNLVSYADQTATQHNQGFNDVIDSVGKAISNIFSSATIPCIIGMVVCIVICIALLIFMLSPAGQEATTTAANAGATYAAKM
jgi:hypothetical protein